MNQDQPNLEKTTGVMWIYLSKDEFRPGLPWFQRLFFNRPLYSDIIQLARQAGLWGATAIATNVGFTYNGKKWATFHADCGFINSHVRLELIGPRVRLEKFHKQILPLIGEKRLVIYSDSECWESLDGHESKVGK